MKMSVESYGIVQIFPDPSLLPQTKLSQNFFANQKFYFLLLENVTQVRNNNNNRSTKTTPPTKTSKICICRLLKWLGMFKKTSEKHQVRFPVC